MEYVNLGDVATYINGYAFKPEQRGKKGLPIIRIQDLNGNSHDLGFFDGEYPKQVEINAGDILISWSGSLGVYKWNKGKALLNQHIFKVLFNKIKIDKEYFCYAVKNSLSVMSQQSHGATMKHITKKDFDKVLIPYPSLNTQRKIAQKLNIVTELIVFYETELSLMEQLIKARFIEMFGDPVSNSKHLPLKTLPQLGAFGRGVSKYRPRNAPELLNGPYPLIQTGDIANSELYIKNYNNTYSEVGLKQSKMWDKGTLCITIAANIAKTAILQFDACFPDSVVGFNGNNLTNNIFVHYWFSFFQEILENQAPESAQKNINLKILSELQIITPDIIEQNQFADFVQQVDKSREEVKKSLEKTQQLYDSLMQEYFG